MNVSVSVNWIHTAHRMGREQMRKAGTNGHIFIAEAISKNVGNQAFFGGKGYPRLGNQGCGFPALKSFRLLSSCGLSGGIIAPEPGGAFRATSPALLVRACRCPSSNFTS